jgi:hypothetical protein
MTNILSLPQIDNAPFRIVTNADFRDGVQFLQDVTVDPAVPLDISGISFRVAIRDPAQLDEVLLTASTADGTIVVDGENGVISFAIPAAQLQHLEAMDAVGDIVAEADGVVICLTKENGPVPFLIRRGLV